MILLQHGQSSQQLIVTLNESRTLDSGYYLFVFTHILTRNVVNKIYGFIDDDSPSQDRYNQFEINTATVFSGQPEGFWNYDVYEQASSTNTDVSGLTLVENGIMKLLPVTGFDFVMYSEATSFKTYEG